MATMTETRRVEKKEGSIGNSFASLENGHKQPLPSRYLELKRSIAGSEGNQKALIAAWSRLIDRLANLTDEIERKKQSTIPECDYESLVQGSDQDSLSRIKQCGSVVVHNTFPEDQALNWLDQIREYIKQNPQVKGFPENDKQVYEIYWSKAQQEARSHRRMLDLQVSLLSLFEKDPADTKVSVQTPLLYADRLRIRNPGDAQFALGPHMDSGSIERWEDPEYRQVFNKILSGKWEEYSAWDMEHRAPAVHDLYPGPGSTSVFRSWQGWTSLSETGPGEGTLLVYPFIREQTAYVLMRPFFSPKRSKEQCKDLNAFLAADNWKLDITTSDFPGSPLYKGQELTDETHPHLQLQRSMVCMPKVRPGDSVWWHCDAAHAVESKHGGTGPAAVMYIPAVPLTAKNAAYIRDQRETLLSGKPGPDFPGGVGESHFQGRAVVDDIVTVEGKEGFGLTPFRVDESYSEKEKQIRETANTILGF